MTSPDILTPVVSSVFSALAWVLPALLAGAAFKVLLPGFLGGLGEAKVNGTLRLLGLVFRHDLILPDGRGGLTQIDHLVLTPCGILVIETKNYSGIILGQANDAQWTQVTGRRRHQFQNPLRQNYAHTQAIKALAPGVPISGRVVFVGRARFPNGMPAGVILGPDLAEALRSLTQCAPDPRMGAVWEDLLRAACTDRAARQEHLAGLQARYGGNPIWRRRLAWVVLVVSALGVVWLWPHRRSASVPGLVEVQRTTPVAPIGPVSGAPASSWPVLPAPVAEAPVAQGLLPPAPVGAAPPLGLSPAAPSVVPGAASGASGPVPSAPPGGAPAITWTDPRDAGPRNEACTLARAAVLIENTTEARRERDRVCGKAAD